MSRKIVGALVFSFAMGAAMSLAQEQQPAAGAMIPAASPSQIECSGFITAASISSGDLYVVDGADNDFQQRLRAFFPGNFVYLGGGAAQSLAVGNEYRLVRPAGAPLISGVRSKYFLPLLGHTSWYRGQRSAMGGLGQSYEDVGRVKVVRVTPEGGIAEVEFACNPVSPFDIAIAYQPRPIPQYDAEARSDRFAPSKAKVKGAIAAAAYNAGAAATQKMVYINRGNGDGVRPGQRFRIYHIARDLIGPGFGPYPTIPREYVGELVVLTTQERSSVGIVINCLRDISLGDGIELE